MLDDQYSLFRDIDRRCVAGGLLENECREAVRLKRASIESDRLRGNPVVRDVLAGRTTFVAVYGEFSRAFRGLRRVIPMGHDAAWNERLRHLAEILPNVRHFTRRSWFAIDNPLIAAAYGLIAAVALGIVGARATEDDVELPGGEDAFVSVRAALIVVLGLVGIAAGSFAMLKYRVRDPKRIHAREAAEYMDLNYSLYRSGDDAAWAEFVRTQGAALAGTSGRSPDSSRRA